MSLYLSTLRYLTVEQVWHRGIGMTRRRWRRLIGQRCPQPRRAHLLPHTPLYAGLTDLAETSEWADELALTIDRAVSISRGDFCFLNQKISFADDVRWNDPDLSHLWRYNLHYFNYAGDLLIWGACRDGAAAYEVFRRLAMSWIDHNQLTVGDGWHPYTISLRVVNWLHALSGFSAQISVDKPAADKLLFSVYGQTQFLFSNLELDVRGNHLLENLRALIWAGLVFEGPEPRKWFERGLSLLEAEVKEQVLSDGGHFERTPGYHLAVFRDLLEIAIWVRRNTDSVPLWLENALRRMGHYLRQIIMPDGNVPLLKDTTWDRPYQPLDILAACAIYLDEPSLNCGQAFGLYQALIFGPDSKRQNKVPIREERGSVELPASKHYVIRDEREGDYLIFDAGKPCPDYLPAHAHADLLSYELTVSDQRIIVDSGVYEYTAGSWRDYFRSTRAHNTVEVAGENQSEVWSSFRVARRARPGPVYWESQDNWALVQSEHDGYQRLSAPLVHQRTVFAVYGRFWLFVDQLWGDQETSFSNHIHLHPELLFEPTDHSTWRIQNSRAPLWLTSFGQNEESIVSGQVDPITQGWYSERFGELRANSVLTFQQRACLPHSFGYAIAREAPTHLSATPIPNGHRITLNFQQHEYRLQLVRHEPPVIS